MPRLSFWSWHSHSHRALLLGAPGYKQKIISIAPLFLGETVSQKGPTHSKTATSLESFNYLIISTSRKPKMHMCMYGERGRDKERRNCLAMQHANATDSVLWAEAVSQHPSRRLITAHTLRTLLASLQDMSHWPSSKDCTAGICAGEIIKET